MGTPHKELNSTCATKVMALGGGVSVVLGGQWGDEGKGKLVDILAQDADIVARCQVNLSLNKPDSYCLPYIILTTIGW